MIRHLLKIVWNRKRANLLVAIEILLSFLVMVGVVTLAVFYIDNYRRPLGFDVADIWTVTAESNSRGRESTSVTVESGPGILAAPKPPAESRHAIERTRIAQFLGLIKDLPEVQHAAAGWITPYSGNTWNSDIEVGGRRYEFYGNRATDEFAVTMGLEITRGRWFDRRDDGVAWNPVVVNERMAREMFPGQDPVDRYIDAHPGAPDPDRRRMRIIGVIGDFRKDGEYSPARNFLFERNRLDDPDPEVEAPTELVIRVRPGTTAAFEEKLVARLRAAAPDWTFQSEQLSQSRDTALQLWLAPVSILGVVSVFLLAMVTLGLTGVLWMNVTQRTREVGLRRAKGATAVNIRRQIIGEVFVLTSVAVVVGILVVLQFPLLELTSTVSPGVYAVSLAISLVAIFALCLGCAWAPSRLASSVQPAEALRYE